MSQSTFEHEVFPNAPIVEALLNIEIAQVDKSKMADLQRFGDQISDRFPKKQDRKKFEGGVSFDFERSQQKVDTTIENYGYAFLSEAEKVVVQARIDGFSFSKLQPYDHWETLEADAKKLWALYSDFVEPLLIERLALRYINRIDIPRDADNFEDYFYTFPRIAPGIPQLLSNFFNQIVVPNPEIDSTAIITMTMEKPTEKVIPVILDIDVQRQVQIEGASPEVWEMFSVLRDFKNQIFFCSITDLTRELFR